MKLCCASFYNDRKLAEFVNRMGIRKEDIQQIVSNDGETFTLFYWSEEDNE